MVPVVEQADVPASTELLEKLRKGAWTLWELEAAQPFVADLWSVAADHVTHVQLGELVVGEVHGLVARRSQLRYQRRSVLPRVRREAHEDMRLLAAAQSIVELGDGSAADHRAELLERARLLGKRDGDE